MREVFAPLVAPHRDAFRSDASWQAISDQLILEVAVLDPGAGAAPDRGATKKASEAPRTVLVVDDDPDMRTYLAQCLKAIDRRVEEVLEAADGIEALALLGKGRVDLVITDVVMPRLDGIGLCTRIREDETLRRIPVLLVSGEAALDAVRRSIPDDAPVRHLAKPFSARMLRDAIAPLWT